MFFIYLFIFNNAVKNFFQMNNYTEENLPRNLMKVNFVSLVVRKPALSNETRNINTQVKNFKKFKKVFYAVLILQA